MKRNPPPDDSRRSPTSGLVVTAHAKGSVIEVRAQAGARVTAIRGVHAGALKVSVTQVAEKGKANKALIEVLRRELELRKSQIELVAGETAVNKSILIRGVTVAELSQRIQAVLEQL